MVPGLTGRGLSPGPAGEVRKIAPAGDLEPQIGLWPILGAGGPIVHASLPAGPGCRRRLATLLLEELAGIRPECRGWAETRALVLRKDRLGKPQLMLGDAVGPSISFSHSGNRIYAAAVAQGQVGCDASRPAEFEADYPFRRAFLQRELDLAARWGLGLHHAAPFLWSLKEAAVKALGVGFNFLDPLAVEVKTVAPAEGGFLGLVQVDRSVAALAGRENGGWLALAWTPDLGGKHRASHFPARDTSP